VVSVICKTRESRICFGGGVQTAERKMRSQFWFAENELRSLRAEKERDCVGAKRFGGMSNTYHPFLPFSFSSGLTVY